MSKKKIIFLSIAVLVIVLVAILIWHFLYNQNRIDRQRDIEILQELESFPTMTKESLPSNHPMYDQVKTEKEIINDLKSL
jgi:sensor domain CHASE-containing protein